MQHIHKLPYLLACAAAMITGMASYTSVSDSSTLYLRMAVVMVVFFIAGIYIKNTILSIDKEVQEKKKEKDAAEELQNTAATAQTEQSVQEKGQQIHKVDLLVEDDGDVFEPLAMSKAISSKVKEQ